MVRTGEVRRRQRGIDRIKNLLDWRTGSTDHHTCGQNIAKVQYVAVKHSRRATRISDEYAAAVLGAHVIVGGNHADVKVDLQGLKKRLNEVADIGREVRLMLRHRARVVDHEQYIDLRFERFGRDIRDLVVLFVGTNLQRRNSR